MRQFCACAVVAWTFVLLPACSIWAADPTVDEQVIAPPAGSRGNAFIISQRGLHVAVVGASGSRMVVTVDGVAGPVLDQVLLPNGQPFGGGNSVGVSTVGDIGSPVLLSPDGDHYAYAGRIGDDVIVIHDGKEIARGPYNASVLNFGALCFSPNGKHLFFTLTSTANGVKRQFMMDGKVLPILPQQSPPEVLFSQDDSRYAYFGITEAQKPVFVVDGKDAGYLGDSPRFSADNKLLTIGRTDNKSILQIDGKPSNHGEGVLRFIASGAGNKIITFHARPNPGGQLYYLVVDGKKVDETECINNITRVAFSPDGKRYMARCVGQAMMWMVVDGKKELTYNGIGDDFSFSADSTKYAYLATSAASPFFIIDGKEFEVGVMGAKPIFSPKGSRLAYVTGENRLKMKVTVDGTTGPMLSDIPGVVFSPDGSRYAYQFNTMMSASLNVDGTEQAGLLAGQFQFSPDGKHVAVTGQRRKDGANGFFIDNQLVNKQTGRFTRQVFTPDGKHIYLAMIETGQPVQLAIYLDGKLVKKYDANANSVFEQMPESWDVNADGVLTFLAATAEGMKKVCITPPADTSVDTMVADAKAAEEKLIADAAKAKADAEAARLKAAADAQKAREDAAAARTKAAADAAAARAAARQKAADDAAAARAARGAR